MHCQMYYYKYFNYVTNIDNIPQCTLPHGTGLPSE